MRRRVGGLLAAGVVLAGAAVASPAFASPFAGTSLTQATQGVQSAQDKLAAAEQDVRSATAQAQQIADAVVELRGEQASAQVDVTNARADARQAIRFAYDSAGVDPSTSLLADLSGSDPGLADQVRNRQMRAAGARIATLEQSVAHLGAVGRMLATRRVAADQAAARAISAADSARIQLAAAEKTDSEVRQRAAMAAQRRELGRLNAQLAASLLSIEAGSEKLVADTPAELRKLYQRAATTCPGLPWGVLAGIGQVETDNGRVKAVSSAGAMGPMQFMPATWAVYGVDGDGDGKADILNQVDAVYSAAHYLCASGGGKSATLYAAIFAYNHSNFYVNTVLGLAAQYH